MRAEPGYSAVVTAAMLRGTGALGEESSRWRFRDVVMAALVPCMIISRSAVAFDKRTDPKSGGPYSMDSRSLVAAFKTCS